MSSTTLRATATVGLDPPQVFQAVATELVSALAGSGFELDPAAGAAILQHGEEIGRVFAWKPPRRFGCEWRPAPWRPEAVRIELRCEPAEGGTRVDLDLAGLAALVDDPGELAGWFAGEAMAPLLAATAPARFGDWLADRGARRPSGARARATYGDPIYHFPLFRIVLDELAPGPGDVLLEVGCGGGVFLEWALARRCRAGAVDHSLEMVGLARERNQRAVDEGRLAVFRAGADRLPFPEARFTCATMIAVFGFLPDPVAALAEVRRVLRPGGRLFLPGSDPEDRGTMAAPEPFASRLRFYDDEELARVARDAGFTEVRVERRSQERHARDCGIPEEHLPLFAGPGPRFLLARKPG